MHGTCTHLSEDFVHPVDVEEVALVEGQLFARDLLDSLEGRSLARVGVPGRVGGRSEASHGTE